jgi:hypothetical protein
MQASLRLLLAVDLLDQMLKDRLISDDPLRAPLLLKRLERCRQKPASPRNGPAEVVSLEGSSARPLAGGARRS